MFNFPLLLHFYITINRLVYFLVQQPTTLLPGNSNNLNLNKEDERDIAKRIKGLNADLGNQGNLIIHVEILDKETR